MAITGSYGRSSLRRLKEKRESERRKSKNRRRRKEFLRRECSREVPLNIKKRKKLKLPITFSLVKLSKNEWVYFKIFFS